MKKLKQFKAWLSSKILIPQIDKIKHYIVLRYPAIVITVFGAAANPKWGLIGLVTLLLLAVTEEIRQLIENGFTKVNIGEAIKDLIPAVWATFTGIVIMIIILTNYTMK